MRFSNQGQTRLQIGPNATLVRGPEGWGQKKRHWVACRCAKYWAEARQPRRRAPRWRATSAKIFYSVLCDPSHRGLFADCLQPQKNTFLVSVASYFTGLKLPPL